MFHYLNNPNIPYITNGIEGFWGHLKNHLDLHRGLTHRHYFMDYFPQFHQLFFSTLPENLRSIFTL
jgi:hypothetical protein